jgi:hypothetical protein
VLIAHEFGIPLRAPEQVLEAVRVGQAGRFGQLPTVFALDLAWGGFGGKRRRWRAPPGWGSGALLRAAAASRAARSWLCLRANCEVVINR